MYTSVSKKKKTNICEVHFDVVRRCQRFLVLLKFIFHYVRLAGLYEINCSLMT